MKMILKNNEQVLVRLVYTTPKKLCLILITLHVRTVGYMGNVTTYAHLIMSIRYIHYSFFKLWILDYYVHAISFWYIQITDQQKP